MRVLPENESGLNRVSKKVGDGKTRKDKSWFRMPSGLSKATNFVSKTAKVINEFNRVDKFGNIAGDPLDAILPKRRKKRDPFRVNETKKNPDLIKRGDGIADSVGKMYALFKKIDTEEIQQHNLDKFRRTEQYIQEEQRHEEIVKAIKNLVQPKETKEPPTKPTKPTEKPQKTTKPTAEPATKETSRTIGTTAAKVGVGAGVAAAGVATMSEALAKGESGKAGYNAANMGTRGGQIVPAKPVNLEEMTIEQVMQRQAIKWGDPNQDQKLLSVGKYQLDPGTMKDAVKTLGIPKTEKYDKDTQEKIFRDYLIPRRAPSVVKYLNSPDDNPALLRKSIKELSNVWASVADPDIPGGKTSHYGHGNKASISVEMMADILRKDREKNLKLIKPVEQTNSPTAPVADATQQNLNEKQQLKQVAAASVQYNDKTVIIQQGDENFYLSGTITDDRPAFQKKLKG